MSKIKKFEKEHLMEILDLLEKGNTITSIHKSFKEKFNVEISQSTFRNWLPKSFTLTTMDGLNKWLCINPLYSQLDYFVHIDNNSIQDTQETSECKSQKTPEKISQPPLDENPPNAECLPGSEKIISTLKRDNLTSVENKQSIKDHDEIEILQENISGALFKLEILEKKVLSIEKMVTTHMQENDSVKKLMRQIITLIYDEMINKG